MMHCVSLDIWTHCAKLQQRNSGRSSLVNELTNTRFIQWTANKAIVRHKTSFYRHQPAYKMTQDPNSSKLIPITSNTTQKQKQSFKATKTLQPGPQSNHHNPQRAKPSQHGRIHCFFLSVRGLAARLHHCPPDCSGLYSAC